MRIFPKNGSKPVCVGKAAAAPPATATAIRAVVLLFCALVGSMPAAGQIWNSTTKAASAKAKSIFLTYSQGAGFYPAAVSRSAGPFLIHVAVRDRESTPTFQISDSTAKSVNQASVQKGKPLTVQAVSLDVGVYRITAVGDAAHSCTITVTKQ
jgi:hypothetical protein